MTCSVTAELVLPDNLKAMLICTGLGDGYSNLITTTIHTISTTRFKQNYKEKLVPSIVKSVMGLPAKQRIVGNLPGSLEVLEVLVTRINRINKRHNRTLETRVLEGTRRKAKAMGKKKETRTKERLTEFMLLMRP